MNPNKFSEFIVDKRKEKEISLRRMAELVDLSLAYWSDIEKDRRNPPNINKLQEIASLLGLSCEVTDSMIDIASEDRD